MSAQFKQWMHLGMAVVLGLIVSLSVFAAQGGRGGAPPRGGGGTAPANNGNNGNGGRGGGGGNNTAQLRQQIQAKRKAAIETAEAQFRLSMLTAKQNGADISDPKAKEHAQIEIQQAQLQRKGAIERANAEAKAALAALPKGR